SSAGPGPGGPSTTSWWPAPATRGAASPRPRPPQGRPDERPRHRPAPVRLGPGEGRVRARPAAAADGRARLARRAGRVLRGRRPRPHGPGRLLDGPGPRRRGRRDRLRQGPRRGALAARGGGPARRPAAGHAVVPRLAHGPDERPGPVAADAQALPRLHAGLLERAVPRRRGPPAG